MDLGAFRLAEFFKVCRGMWWVCVYVVLYEGDPNHNYAVLKI